jgi:hypothetical protein
MSDSRRVSITFKVGARLTGDGINHHDMATPDNVDLDPRTRLQYRARDIKGNSTFRPFPFYL